MALKVRGDPATPYRQMRTSKPTSDPEWVTAQTFARLKKEIEAEQRDFEAHLGTLRSREEASKKTRTRATKKPVCYIMWSCILKSYPFDLQIGALGPHQREGHFDICEIT